MCNSSANNRQRVTCCVPTAAPLQVPCPEASLKQLRLHEQEDTQPASKAVEPVASPIAPRNMLQSTHSLVYACLVGAASKPHSAAAAASTVCTACTACAVRNLPGSLACPAHTFWLLHAWGPRLHGSMTLLPSAAACINEASVPVCWHVCCRAPWRCRRMQQT